MYACMYVNTFTPQIKGIHGISHVSLLYFLARDASKGRSKDSKE